MGKKKGENGKYDITTGFPLIGNKSASIMYYLPEKYLWITVWKFLSVSVF